MSPRDSCILDGMTGYIVVNIGDVNELVTHLSNDNALCHVTKAYVLALPATDQRSLRVLEVLSTQEDGMYTLVNALKRTNNLALADALLSKCKFSIEQKKPPD